MTIERDGVRGPIIFECDYKTCRESIETDCFEFSGALGKAKSRGWMPHYVDGEWVHLCPVHEEEFKSGEFELS